MALFDTIVLSSSGSSGTSLVAPPRGIAGSGDGAVSLTISIGTLSSVKRPLRSVIDSVSTSAVFLPGRSGIEGCSWRFSMKSCGASSRSGWGRNTWCCTNHVVLIAQMVAAFKGWQLLRRTSVSKVLVEGPSEASRSTPSVFTRMSDLPTPAIEQSTRFNVHKELCRHQSVLATLLHTRSCRCLLPVRRELVELRFQAHAH